MGKLRPGELRVLSQLCSSPEPMLLVIIQLPLAGQIKEKRGGHRCTTQWRKACNHSEDNKILGENAAHNMMTRITVLSLYSFKIIDKLAYFTYLGSYTSSSLAFLFLFVEIISDLNKACNNSTNNFLP